MQKNTKNRIPEIHLLTHNDEAKEIKKYPIIRITLPVLLVLFFTLFAFLYPFILNKDE